MNVNFNAFNNHNFAIQIPHDKNLIRQLKKIRGCKWHADCKMWSFPDRPEIIDEVFSILYGKQDLNSGVNRSEGHH